MAALLLVPDSCRKEYISLWLISACWHSDFHTVSCSELHAWVLRNVSDHWDQGFKLTSKYMDRAPILTCKYLNTKTEMGGAYDYSLNWATQGTVLFSLQSRIVDKVTNQSWRWECEELEYWKCHFFSHMKKQNLEFIIEGTTEVYCTYVSPMFSSVNFVCRVIATK